MTDTNSIVICGRLTRDMQKETIGQGTSKGTVSIAVNRSIKKGDEWVEEASFFDVILWGKMADGLEPYLTKGAQIIVDGYLKQDRWESKDGEKKSRVCIYANSVQLAGGNRQNSSPSSSPAPQSAPAPQYRQKAAPQMQQDMNGYVEDVPF